MVVGHFGQLPVPLKSIDPTKEIKVVVLDKDNCFATPHSDGVFPDYRSKWAELCTAYPGARLLIVSNTAGSDDDVGYSLARHVEHKTGVKVFRHSSKKPGCYHEILQFVQSQGLAAHPAEIAVVGDRLLTDIAMANLMGSSSVWVRDGVVPKASIFTSFEKRFYDFWAQK
jgi:phosphatidylglycerophosphatase GEP4